METKTDIGTDGGKGFCTERLWLREARESDLLDFHAFMSNEDVMRYWSGPPFTELSQTESYLKRMVSSANNGISDFSIVLQSSESPKVIGKVGIWDPETSEIGFMLNRAYWGKGYMAEALSALLDYLWSGKGGEVPFLTADVDPRNDASLGILKKFRFYQYAYKEKTCETHLGWCDSVYLILKNPNVKPETDPK